ncbi:hypothetical protein GN958_ATG18886 [Phytophthora infestans]|uniref:Uncharacterized protein n=1 Tax=Phytophthora infestans TaxID=4787 RepID=A0A8S9TV08_PHYIN|nr:hypothetical protein GN958_ATG18886 [Phytophthora infestans]
MLEFQCTASRRTWRLQNVCKTWRWHAKKTPRHLETLQQCIKVLKHEVVQWPIGLKRLELTKISLLSKHIPEIVEATASHCRHLEFLILPRNLEKRSTVSGPSIDKVMTTLYAAMERRYPTGGLKQLTLPSRSQSDRYHGGTKYIENVTTFCPKIEYLDGYWKVISYSDVHYPEMWTISLETWRAFNAKCSNLRSFHWFAVPFADPFFRVFGEYVKPK